jgi:hypothetical protein
MDMPKTSLKDQYVKLSDINERRVKHLDSFYTPTFLNNYFSHFKKSQSSNKHS